MTFVLQLSRIVKLLLQVIDPDQLHDDGLSMFRKPSWWVPRIGIATPIRLRAQVMQDKQFSSGVRLASRGKAELETDYALLPGFIEPAGKLRANRYTADIDALEKLDLVQLCEL